MPDLFTPSRPGRSGPGHHDRPGARRRQRRRHRLGGRRAAGRATPARHPGRHRRRRRRCASHSPMSRSNCSRSSACVLAGGILLLWVSWKMWRELRASARAEEDASFDAPRRSAAAQDLRAGRLADRNGGRVDVARQRAGGGGRRARASVACWCSGLVLSIVLMGFAANIIARLLHRHRWIAYVGLAIVALRRARHDLARAAGKSRSGFKSRMPRARAPDAAAVRGRR